MMEAALCSCQWEWMLIMGGGISLYRMTSSGLLRAEAEPLGLRATCVQCFQRQNVFFPFSIEWCWRNAILREETGEARDRTQKTIGRGEHKRLCLWVFQILFCVCPRSSPSSDLRVGEDHSFQPVNHPSTFTVSICWVFSVIEALGSHLNTFEPPSS